MACQGHGNSYNAADDDDAGGQMKRDEHVNNTPQDPSDYFQQSQPQMYQPINLQSQSYGQDTNFLNQTGEQVKTLANGAIFMAQGAASGAANLAQGAAQAVKTTFGINSSSSAAASANSRSNLPTTMNNINNPTTKQ